MSFIRRLIAAYKFMQVFPFTEKDLPTVVTEEVDLTPVPSKRYTYYRVGRWQMEVVHPDPHHHSDSDPEYVRDAVLSWMAWWRHVNRAQKGNK